VNPHKGSALNLPGGESESSPVSRKFVSTLDSPRADPSSEFPAVAGSALLASLQGRVSFHQDHIPTGIHIGLVGIDPATENAKVFRSVSVNSDSGVQDGVHMTFAWEMEDLLPGMYRITYAKASIQGVTLAAGPNEIFAVLGEPQTLVLMLQDSLLGKVIPHAEITWANQVDEHPVGNLAAEVKQRNIYPLRAPYRFGEVQTERIFLAVVADGYEGLFTTVYLADGARQILTLDPICSLLVSKLGENGERSNPYKELTLGSRFRLSIGGQLYTPVSSGCSVDRFYATFDVPLTRAGDWEFVPPEGHELVEIEHASAGPGLTIYAVIR
jgi:hypothetical protein